MRLIAVIALLIAMLLIAAWQVRAARRSWLAKHKAEEKSYGLHWPPSWQFTGNTTSSSLHTGTQNATVTWENILHDVDRMSAVEKRAKHLAERRRVRVFEQHSEIEDSDYHEWVPSGEGNVRRDALCRKSNGAMWSWQHWCCNNLDCEAEAYVSVAKVEEVVQGWLDRAAPKPGSDEQHDVYLYQPWTVSSGPPAAPPSWIIPSTGCGTFTTTTTSQPNLTITTS